MNPEPHGERIVRDTTSPRPFVSADHHTPDGGATELEAAQRALASEHVRLTDALSRAESALAMRDEVLAIVAHDLRAPLNAVQSSAAFLTDVELAEPERRRLLDVIRRAASSIPFPRWRSFRTVRTRSRTWAPRTCGWVNSTTR